MHALVFWSMNSAAMTTASRTTVQLSLRAVQLPSKTGQIWLKCAGDLLAKVNRPIRVYGAGDGNRTHVRSLGSFYTAIVRRPLVSTGLAIIHNLAARRTG